MKAIKYYEQSIQMGDKNAMNNIANMYEFAVGIPKNLSKAAFYYFSSMKLKDMNSQIKFFDIINHSNVEWRSEYHVHWPKSEMLNQQIICLLLISKFRNQIQKKEVGLILSILSKVVAMEIISYLCQLEKKLTKK